MNPAFFARKPFTPTDPYWSNVVLLMDGQAPNTNGGAATDKSSYAHSVNTVNGSLLVSSANSLYGGLSVANNGGQDTYFTSATEFQFGTGDFTAEAWVRLASFAPSHQGLVAKRNGSSNTNKSWLFCASSDTTGTVTMQEMNGSGQTVRALSTKLSLNTYAHIAWCVQSGVLRGYFNGTKEYEAASTFDFGNNSENLWVACNVPATGCMVGNFYLRLTKGVGRYGSSNFTPPSTFLPS